MKISYNSLAKEGALQKGIREYLEYMRNQRKLFFVRVFSGQTHPSYINKEGIKKYRCIKGAKEGTSDWIIFLRGKTLFMETKTRKGKQSKEQIEFQEDVEYFGYKYYLYRDIKTFMEIIKENLEKVAAKSSVCQNNLLRRKPSMRKP